MKPPKGWKMWPLWAFYTPQGSGFLMYQDANGFPVAEGVLALKRWEALGCPTVRSYSGAVRLRLVAR